jgi:hypothetical protein
VGRARSALGRAEERAGGGVAPKRRCFGLGVSGTVALLEKLNNSVKELEGKLGANCVMKSNPCKGVVFLIPRAFVPDTPLKRS